jgi:hypothetical protein
MAGAKTGSRVPRHILFLVLIVALSACAPRCFTWFEKVYCAESCV